MSLHVSEVKAAVKIVEIVEELLPDIEAVVAQFEAANGHRPSLRDVWPSVEKGLDHAVNDTPLGTIRV